MVNVGRLRRGGIFGTIIGLVLGTSVAVAEQCNFTVECFEGETCSETLFDLTLENGQMITDAETVQMTRGGSETVGVFVGVTASAFHVLTRTSEGNARYSTHIYDGPLMVNYIGTCE